MKNVTSHLIKYTKLKEALWER